MRACKTTSTQIVLRWEIFLTMVEMMVIGIVLMHAHSLEKSALLLGYSLPRLILLVSWLFVFGGCTWMVATIVKNPSLFEKLVTKVFQLVSLEGSYSRLRDWLIVMALVSWTSVGLFLMRPGFWAFIWPSLPVLLGQYLLVLVILGIWAVQSLMLIWVLVPLGVEKILHSESVGSKAVLIFFVAFIIYAYTAVSLGIAPSSKTAYFPELAQAFLHGRLDLVNPPATKDLTPFNGKYYVSFPPLAALLMMPFVALRGPLAVNVLLFNDFFAALGVMFTFLMLEAFRQRGWNGLRWWDNMLLAFFLGFSTAQYYLSAHSLVNLISQILTVTFLTLSFWIVLARAHRLEKRYATLAGGAIGLAMLARPNVLFALVSLVTIQIEGSREADTFSWQRFLQWIFALLAPIAIVMLGLCWYNWARFGSFFDFGYEYMLVADVLIKDLHVYGQFHPHFLLENLFDNFVRFPYWDTKCSQIVPNPQGMSIFITSPLIIYLVLAFKKKIWVIGMWISISMIALSHALYYNSGALQYGYRFSLDFIPMVVALLAFGFKNKLPKFAYGLIIFGVAANYIGVLWSTHRWCINY